MVFWNAIALLGVQQAAMAREISVDLPCLKAETVVREVGERAGLELSASGSVAQECLMIRFQGRPVGQVLDEIAKTLEAEWVRAGSRMELQRPPRRAARYAETAEPFVQAGLASFRPLPAAMTPARAEEIILRSIELSEPGKGDPEEQLKIAAETPNERLLRRLAVILGPEELSGIAPGQRRTYTDSPTDRQFRLPGAGGMAINEYYFDLAVYLEAFSRLGGHGVQTDDSGSISPYQQMEGPPIQVMLAATRRGDDLVLELNGLTRMGEYHELASVSIQVAEPASTPASTLADPLSRLTQPITLPVEIQAAVSEGPDVEAAISRLKERLATSLLHWGEAEALADLPTLFMRSALSGLTSDYVVVVPDSSLQAWPDLVRRQLPGGYAAVHLLGGNVDQQESDGVVRLRPKQLTSRLPRDLAARVIGSLKAEGRATLEQAALLARYDETANVWATLWSLAAFSLRADFQLEPLLPSEIAILRAYSMLSQSDKEAAASPDGLNRPIANWPLDFRPLVLADGGSLHPPGADPTPLTRTQPKSLAADPSYVLSGTGLANCSVTMLVRRQDRIFEWDSSGKNGLPEPIELEDLVLKMMDQEEGKSKMTSDRFAVAPVESLVVRLDFGMAGFVQHAFAVRSLPKGTALLPYAQLPAEWQTRVSERLRQARGALSGGATGLPLTIPPL